MATDLIGYIFSFSFFFISRGLFERSPLNDLDNDRYLHAHLVEFCCCCSNSAYLTTANSRYLPTDLLHLENLSVAVYLMCVYARCSIARLFLTYLVSYCTEDEESFNSFLPRTFYLKMAVVVHIACRYCPPPSYMYHGY